MSPCGPPEEEIQALWKGARQSRLASGSTDQTVCVWDIQNGRSHWTGHEHAGTVTSVAWHPSGTILASSSEDHTVLVWDAERGGVLLRLHGHEGPVYDVAWSPDGTQLASCGGSSRKGEISMWDASSGTLIRALVGHPNPVFSVVWSPDGALLVSGGTDGSLLWWDWEEAYEMISVHMLEGAEMFPLLRRESFGSKNFACTISLPYQTCLQRNALQPHFLITAI